jgi:hypothetical protein
MFETTAIMERKIDEGDKCLLDHYAADLNLRKDEAVRFVNEIAAEIG